MNPAGNGDYNWIWKTQTHKPNQKLSFWNIGPDQITKCWEVAFLEHLLHLISQRNFLWI